MIIASSFSRYSELFFLVKYFPTEHLMIISHFLKEICTYIDEY